MGRRSLASEGDRMNNHPPRWAQSFLRAILDPRDRETVSGDLLEEYVEARLPAFGVVRANLWYVRQVVSLITCRRLLRLAEDPSWNSAIVWAVAAALIEFVFVFVVPGSFGVSVAFSGFVLAVCVLGIGGSTALDSASRSSVVQARYWGLLAFAVIVGGTALPRLMIPIFAISLVSIFIAAGFHGAWKSGLARTGTLITMMTSALAILLVQTSGALSSALGGASELHPPMPNLFMLFPISILFGTLGAFASKGLAAILRNHGLRRDANTQILSLR